MTDQEFTARTKQVALSIIRLIEVLPNTSTATIIGEQLLRSSASIGSNFRAACRGRSLEEVAEKLSIVEKEADETLYWIELLTASHLVPEKTVAGLRIDIDEIVSVTVAKIKTLRYQAIDHHSNSNV